MEYKSLQDAAAEIARVVGARLREVLNSPDTFEVNFKGARDLVTEFDVWAEDQIREFLLKRFPEHQIIGEETSAELQGTVGATLETIAADSLSWCIDPIDGTTNFVSSIPHVGISIGFLEKGVAKAGVVYDPCRDELFSASFGGGASVNSHRIKPANNPEMINAVIATGFPYDKAKAWERCGDVFQAVLKEVRGVRRFGAATLDGCWTACGRFDGFYEFGLSPWDVSAAAIIAQEAGCKVINFDKASSETFSLFGNSFLFCSSALYPALFKVIQTAQWG
ncbi:MAG: inositol monophosphatase [Bdellovibrionales bacterium]|nr:inositol monophosphatase [Bdellovibrionales bacterium]